MARLTTRDLNEAQMAVYRAKGDIPARTVELALINAEIHERIKVFEAAVWFPRLQAQVNGTRERGMSTTVKGLKIMTWCCAGRCMIQLEEAGSVITLITADNEKPWNRDMSYVAPPMGPMGLQHIDAEHIDALTLLYKATRNGNEITLTPDDGVGIGL